MKRLMLLWLLSVAAVFGQSVADSFCYPVSPYSIDGQDESQIDCGYHSSQRSDVFYLGQDKNGQRFLDRNDAITSDHKYHLGTDLNSSLGASNDLGDFVFAPANGRVILVHNVSHQDSWGKVVIIRHLLPTGQTINSLYGHLDSILVSQGQDVSKGHKIGTIGDGNGYYQNQAHLHFEMFLEHKVPDGVEWSDVVQIFRGYINSPESTNVHGSIDPIFFIKTEMVKEGLGIKTGLVLNRTSFEEAGCVAGGNSPNRILNQFTNMRPESLFVIPRTNTYRFGSLPMRASEAVRQSLIFPIVWEETADLGKWKAHDLLNSTGDTFQGPYWVCPVKGQKVDIAHDGVGWHKFDSTNNKVSVIPVKEGGSAEVKRWGRTYSAPSGATGTINYVFAPLGHEGFQWAYVHFDSRSVRDGYVRNPWLMPRIELGALDYPPSMCPDTSSSQTAYMFGNKDGFSAKYASSAVLSACEPEPPTDAVVELSAPSCQGGVPVISVTVSGAVGADYVRVYRDDSFVRELPTPLYPFTDVGEVGQSYTYRAVARNENGNAGSNLVVSDTFPNCSEPLPPPVSSFSVITGEATRERHGELKFTGIIGQASSTVDWWFEFGADPTRLVRQTDEHSLSSTAPRDVDISWKGFVCDQVVYYRLAARQESAWAYGETSSINTGMCGEAPRIESIEGGIQYGSSNEARIVVETYSKGFDLYASLVFGTSPTSLTRQIGERRFGSGDDLEEKPYWVTYTPSVECGVPYYYKGHVRNAMGEAESEILAYTLPCPSAPTITRVEAPPHRYPNAVQFRATVFTSGGDPTRVWFVYSFWDDDYPKSRSTTQNTLPGVNHTEDFWGYPNVTQCGLVVYFQAVAENSYGKTISPTVRTETAPCQ